MKINFMLSIVVAVAIIFSSPTMLISMERVEAYHRAPLNTYTWTLNGNGQPGPLVISPQADGRITGTVYGQPIIGFWDDNTHKILFMRMINQGEPSSFQIFKGYMFVDTVTAPNGVLSCFHILAGEFLTPAGAGGSPQRNEFGWYARSNGFPCD